MIDILDVRKSYHRRTVVLDGTSFRVDAGQAVALWGSNGAGKTTLIRCLLGLVDFRGDIRVAGLDVRRDGKAVRRRVGYVPQEMTFYDDFRVLEAARFIARLRRTDRRHCELRLDEQELLTHAHKRVRELSGGMKQRLALALAMLNDPPVLVLDEPTSNLDTAGRRALFGLLIGLKNLGKTILFISHRNEEVSGLADRVLTLEGGRVIRDETPPAAGDALSDTTLDRTDDLTVGGRR